jgi:hypothetical protein
MQWEKTKQRMKEWLRTDVLASPKDGDVRLMPEVQRDLWRRQRETIREMEGKK